MTPLIKLRRKSFPVGEFLLFNFLLICFLFQIFLITKLTFLYPVLKFLFVLECLGLVVAFIQISMKQKIMLLALFLIIAIRIPFYAKGDGLIFHSDNALEALQALETHNHKTAPFFLLNSSSHNGTLKYLFVAFIWDFFGTSYVSFVLFQLLIFLVFIFIMSQLFKRFLDEKVVLLFLLVHFAFIEVIFDYSLFLRAAPYLEMLTVFLLGVYLFDFTLTNRIRLFQATFFLLFSAYLHSLIIFLLVPFGLTVILLSFSRKMPWINLIFLSAGGLAGSYHLIYYKLYGPIPPPSGQWWYRIVFFSPSQFCFGDIPHYFQALARDLWTAFHNLFDFEFLYSLEFFKDMSFKARLLRVMNRSIVYLSAAVVLFALVLSFKKLFPRIKEKFNERNWPYLFYILTLITLVSKAFLLSPRPHYEPRHNIDMAFWVVMGYLLASSALVPPRKLFSFRFIVLLIFFFAMSIPHYTYYLKIAQFKKESYQEIIPLLKSKGVRYLATDFSIAYPIYFLTNQRVEVTDSLGPVTASFFYPWLKEKVDKISWKKKAYLFFGDNYYRRSWHKAWTHDIQKRILTHLKNENVPYTIHRLSYYTVIIPKPAATRNQK